MGDISEYRGLITVVTFLGIFVVLLQLIPYQFFTAGEQREVDVPDELFEVIDIYAFAEANYWYLNDSAPEWWFDNQYRYWSIDLGGWDIDFYFKKPGESVLNYCWFVHIWTEWFIWPSDHRLTIYTKTGVSQGDSLTLEEIGTTNPVAFKGKCDHTTYHFSLGYNSTSYSSFETAWDAGEVALFVGVNFDDVNTSYNAFDLIGTLLFFAFPVETPLMIKIILAIPIWACVSYLIFIFILRAIGAVFGGGGA